MSIKDKIKELKRQLDLKTAWTSVQVSFGKGNKFNEEIKKQIVEELVAYCAARAEDLDSTQASSSSLGFNEKEVQILKNVASNILKRTNQPLPTSAKKEETAVVSHSIKKEEQPLMVEIMRTDNIPYPQNKYLEVGQQVPVVAFKDDIVIIKTKDGQKIGISKEDVQA